VFFGRGNFLLLTACNVYSVAITMMFVVPRGFAKNFLDWEMENFFWENSNNGKVTDFGLF